MYLNEHCPCLCYYSETCHERPLAWETTCLDRPHILAEGPTFQYTSNWTCQQRPPVLTDHIFVANGVVFQDRFYCADFDCWCDWFSMLQNPASWLVAQTWCHSMAWSIPTTNSAARNWRKSWALSYQRCQAILMLQESKTTGLWHRNDSK